MKKCLIIAHGKKITPQKLSIWIEVLKSFKWECDFFFTSKKGDGEEKAKNSLHDMIIAFGGDGTISEVVNGIFQNNKDIIFSFIPMGTGNDFSKSTYYIKKIDDFKDKLKNYKITKIDLFQIKNKHKKRIIVNIADVGLGGLVVKYVEEFILKKIKKPYFRAIIKGFKNYKKSKIKLHFNQKTHTFQPLLIAFANGSYFGNGIGIAPHSSCTNEKIAITIIKNINLITYLWFLPKLKKNKLINHPKVKYHTTKKVEFYKNDLLFEIDGEPYEFKKGGIIEVLPKKLSILI